MQSMKISNYQASRQNNPTVNKKQLAFGATMVDLGKVLPKNNTEPTPLVSTLLMHLDGLLKSAGNPVGQERLLTNKDLRQMIKQCRLLVNSSKA